MSATAAALVKAAILALTDENTRKKIGWVLAVSYTHLDVYKRQTYRCTLALRSYPASTEELALLRRLGEKSGVTLHIYNRKVSVAEEDKICLLYTSVETAAALFNYGEKFVFNYFELRGAAELLKEGWPLERISDHAVENGCDPTLEAMEESHAALEEFQSGKWDTRENKRKFSSDLSQGCLLYTSRCV